MAAEFFARFAVEFGEPIVDAETTSLLAPCVRRRDAEQCVKAERVRVAPESACSDSAFDDAVRPLTRTAKLRAAWKRCASA